MAKMNSKFKYMYDAAPSVALRARGEAALTADGNSTAIALDKLDGYWNTEEELADQTFAVVVNVDAIDTTTGDEEYVLSLVFGDDAAFTNSASTHSLAVTETGQYVFLVDFDTVSALVEGVSFMRIALDVTGTTPIINYYSWIGGAIIR